MTQILSTHYLSKFKSFFLFGLALVLLLAWYFAASGLMLWHINVDLSNIRDSTLIDYWRYYGDDSKIKNLIAQSIMQGFIITVAPVLYLFSDKQRALYGDAKLASYWDIKKAKLLSGVGIVIGAVRGSIMTFGGELHVLLVAATGMGKGVSVVITTLLTWPDSAVVTDMKLENFEMTSKFRKLCGQAVYFFNPLAMDYKTHRWNPLFYISNDPNFRIDDIQKIAEMVFPTQPKTDPIWYESPRMLFLGICLYILETGGNLTMGDVLRTSLTGGDCKDFFENEIKKGKLSQSCVMALRAYCSITADNTRSGILASFRSALSLWMNPIVDAATSGNDFDLRDIRKKKMTIYLCITPDNMERMGKVINLFIQQLIDLNTRELPSKNQALKYKCLIIADEMRAVGKIEKYLNGAAYARGYGFRYLSVIQSPSQVVEVYGRDAAKTFFECHAMRVVFPPKASDTEAAKEISEWLGYQTVKGKSVSSKLFGDFNASVNQSDQRRAVLLPQEITGLPKGKEIVILENTKPIICDMAFFYKNKQFVDRLKKASPMLRAIQGFPTQKDYGKAVVAGDLSAEVPTIELNQHETPTFKTTNVKVNGKAVYWDDVTPPEPGDMNEDVLTNYTVTLFNRLGVKTDG
jgi:type IV secretion system protein VirD4